MMRIRKAGSVGNFNLIIQTLILCLRTVQFIIIETADGGCRRGKVSVI